VAVPLTNAVLLLALFGSVGALMLTVVAPRLREATIEIRLLAVVLFASSWLPFLANFLGRRRLAASLMILPVTLGTPVATLSLLPAFEGYLNARQVADALNAVSPPRAPLVLADPPPPSLRL